MNRKKQIIIFLLLTFLIIILNPGCKTGEKKEFDVSSEARLNLFLTGMGFDFEPIAKNYNRQLMNFMLGEKNTLEKAESMLIKYFDSQQNRNTLSEWYDIRDTIKDPLLKRQVERLMRMYLINNIEYSRDIRTKISKIRELYLKHARSYGKERSLLDITEGLYSSNSEERTNAYKAMNTDNKNLQRGIIELIRLRQESALRNGYKSYSDLLFRVEEIDPNTVDSILTALEKGTSVIYKLYLDSLTSGNPADYIDIRFLFQTSEMAKLDDLKNSMTKSLRELRLYRDAKIEYKYSTDYIAPHAFTISIPGYFAFILPEYKYDYIQNMSYTEELGRGVYYSYQVETKTLLLGYLNITGSGSSIFSAAVKTFMKRLLWDQKGIEPDYLYEIFHFRYKLMMADFELALYQDPGSDADKLYRQMVKQYLMVEMPTDYETDWCLNYSMIGDPLGFPLDIIGEAAGHQFYEAMQKNLPQVSDRSVYGEWSKKYLFRDGELYPWHKKLRDVSISDVIPDSLLKYYK